MKKTKGETYFGFSIVRIDIACTCIFIDAYKYRRPCFLCYDTCGYRDTVNGVMNHFRIRVSFHGGWFWIIMNGSKETARLV